MTKKLLRPEQVKDWLVRRYNSQHRAWLEGEGEWPLRVPLGIPSESDVATDVAAVRSWVDAWASWSGSGVLETEGRRWVRLGSQTLPAVVVLADAGEVAAWCGQERRWRRAVGRFQALRLRWPQLGGQLGLGRLFDVLADYGDADFERLLEMVSWLLANPASGLYVRQLPVVGVDTKWLEKRTGLVTGLLGMLRGSEQAGDFFAATGLRRQAHRLRLRVLCPEMRRTLGGLCDIEAPLNEVAALGLRPARVLVVENHECGESLPDMSGVVAFIGLGRAVTALATVPWAGGVPAVYWGDIDTHGLAILSSARAVLPGIRSVLMDRGTLETFKDLVVQEPAQATDAGVSNLSEEERALFDGLRGGSWGTKVRLEQERLPWPAALEALHIALHAD